ECDGKIYVTVDQNIKKYTKREVQKALDARTLMDRLGLSESTFRKMTMAGTIHGSEVTIKDIDIAKDIYGQSVPSLQGRMINKNIKDIQTMKIPNQMRSKPAF
ncbi:MAG: hypothetical protein RLZZ152_276, partial [Pseudomonadota bacterium]